MPYSAVTNVTICRNPLEAIVCQGRLSWHSCGDWMSIALKDVFRTKDDSFDLTAFTHCLKEKSIDAPKVVMDRHGAIGRFRMCAGLMFRRRGRKEGFVVIDGNKIMAQREKGADGKHDSRSECRLERWPQDDCRSSVICRIHAQRSREATSGLRSDYRLARRSFPLAGSSASNVMVYFLALSADSRTGAPLHPQRKSHQPRHPTLLRSSLLSLRPQGGAPLTDRKGASSRRRGP